MVKKIYFYSKNKYFINFKMKLKTFFHVKVYPHKLKILFVPYFENLRGSFVIILPLSQK